MTQHTPTNTEVAATPSTSSTAADRIIVNGLVVETFIGVFDVERHERQRVRFDVEIETVADYAEQVRSTGAYVSYADIVDHVCNRAASDEHVTLVETWADDIAEFALRNPLAVAVRVTVQKLDVFDEADGVGVSIERRRANPTGSAMA